MISLEEEKKFLRKLWLIPSLIIISLGFIFVIIMIHKNVIEKQTEFENIKNRVIEKQKEYVKTNINSIVNFISFKKEFAENKLKKYLKEQTNIGYDVIKGIYNNNKNKNTKIIIKLIKDALREVRFNHNRGYYFIYDFNTTNILLPIAKQLEGKNFSNYKDVKGNAVIVDMANIAKTYGEGFYSWYWRKPNNDNINFKKIGYVKAFKPLKLFIGTGEYLDDYIKTLQQEILQELNVNQNNNILIINYNGNALTSSKIDLNIKDNNNSTLKENIIKAAKTNGGFITFQSLDSKTNKVFYVKNIKNLKWIVIQTIDLNKIYSNLSKTEHMLKKQLYTDIIYTIIFVVLITNLIVVLLKNFAQKTALKFIEYKKENEIEKEKRKAKELFLANMSHEIRTPLTAILGFIDILKDNIKNEENKKNLKIIENSSKHLLEVINDILDFSKIEAGKLSIEKTKFNLLDELETIINLFKAKAKEKNISLEVDIDKNTPAVIISDPLRIKQIIANLLSNAIKFTPNGKKIFIKVRYNNKKLCISVEDEGIGIKKENLKNIFKSFTQEDSSITRKYGGTGLGLTISQKLVHLLGGELKVKSKYKKGSKFYFCIPIEIVKQKSDSKKITTNEENMKINKKILVVEDNEANQMLMNIILKKLGATVDIASDGVEAVEKYKKEKYDIILMDENMPNMNGIEATKKILEYEKENNLSHTPIIALTANAMKEDRERFLNAGMDEYLTKPLNKEELIKTLNKFNKRINNGN